MTATSSLLEARGIGRRHPNAHGWLLRDLWLDICAGDRLAIVGPSGAGKTLLLRALALLDPLDVGTVCWKGRPIQNAEVPAFRRQVVYLHQRPVLLGASVEANLRRPFELRLHQSNHFDKERILELLAQLGRDESFLLKAQGELSGGEAQIVALVRALQLEPAVLLMDEPTSALDHDTTQSIEQLLVSWLDAATEMRALIWVTHDHDHDQSGWVVHRKLHMQDGTLDVEAAG